MTKHDFIFSDKLRHRIARHLSFWIIWWIVFLLLFHYPVHSIRGWSLSETSDTLKKLGLTRFILKTLIFNVLFPIILPQIAFTYVLIYYLLPNYFYKKRNPFVTVGILISIFLIFYFTCAFLKFIPPIQNYFSGASKTLPSFLPAFKVGMYGALRDQLTGLPIVAGFALMIKLIKRWWLKQKQTQQLAAEKIKAELQLLKAQIHPHFLFNTLNNIYFFTLSGSPKAPEMIKKLSAMLHYILNECNQQLVPLEKEINMIEDYMALEKIRYGEQMTMTIEIPGNYRDKMIAPLLLIPFVENSFKHGASKMLSNAYVKLRITIENNMLHFFIANSRPKTMEPAVVKGNIGLKNVKKRLQLLYPAAHELNFVSEPESFTVYLKIQLQEITVSPGDNEKIKSKAPYAMA